MAPDISISEVPPAVESHFDMDAWYFTPWIGAQWTPGNRWFASAFGSYRLDTGPISISTPVRDVNIRQPNYLSVDVAMGRWIVQRPGQRGITSLAPTLEMHYTTTTNRGTVFDPGLQNIYDTGRRYGKTDYLNLTAGMNGTINDDWQFGLGVVAPLRTSTTDGEGDFDTDRNFDWCSHVERQLLLSLVDAVDQTQRLVRYQLIAFLLTPVGVSRSARTSSANHTAISFHPPSASLSTAPHLAVPQGILWLGIGLGRTGQENDASPS